MIIFPHSPVMDAAPDDALITDIRDEALNAFFAVVAGRLDDLYPGTRTTGDVDPLEMVHREGIADGWVRSMSLNNDAVAAANPGQWE